MIKKLNKEETKAVEDLVKKFTDTIENLNVDIQADNVWPVIANQLLIGVDAAKQIYFWSELESYFIIFETKKLVHCHKGEIYWRIALLLLNEGDITSTVSNLKKSIEEDNIIGSFQSAATKLLSILSPIITRYDVNNDEWVERSDLVDYYNLLTDNERLELASSISETHDMCVYQQLWVIKDDSFGFIQNEIKRKILKDLYAEALSILLSSHVLMHSSYYSVVFILGSILETMLDDFFQQDSQKYWKLQHNNQGIQKKYRKTSKLLQEKYSESFTLGQKILPIRFMGEENVLPMKKIIPIQMTIINEYRDLIHPQRVVGAPIKPDLYVARFLFTMIGKMAGSWWKTSISKYES